jgi:tetratricopeptide (TPR) repeat protein
MNDADATPAGRSRRTWAFVAIVLVIIAGVAGAVTWALVPGRPADLVEQARAAVERDPAQAERLLRRVLEVPGPKSHEAQLLLCRLLTRRGDWDEAVDVYLQLDVAGCPDAFLVEFGTLARKAGRTAEALDALDAVRRRKTPASIEALDVLFGIYREKHQEREMLDCLREMAELDPGNVALWWKLLEMLNTRRMNADYAQALKQALTHELPLRDKQEMHHRLVAHLVERGDPAEARAELTRLVERDGTSPRSLLHDAAISRIEGRAADALASFEAAFADREVPTQSRRLRGLIHFDLGRFKEAADDFRADVEAHPFEVIPRFKLAEALRGLGEIDLAREQEEIGAVVREKRQRLNRLREETRRRPNDPELCESIAALHRELNEPKDATSWEERASALREGRAGPERSHVSPE